MKSLNGTSVRVMVVVSVLMVLGYAAAVEGQPVIKPLAPKTIQPVQKPPAEKMQQPIKLAQYPQIREFTLTPGVWLMGERGDITFRWSVEPGSSGSPIRSVAIARTSGEGPEAGHTAGEASGEYVFSIASHVGGGKTVYTLTATDEKGATSTRTVGFEVKSMSSVRGDISLVSVASEPAEIAEGAPFTFVVELENRSGMNVPGVDFPVYGKDISMMEASMPLGSEMPPPNQGELSGQAINTGRNTYRIRCTPGVPSGLGDRYLFEIKPKYNDWLIIYIWSRLELSRTTSGVNYYRLRYGSRTLGE